MGGQSGLSVCGDGGGRASKKPKKRSHMAGMLAGKDGSLKYDRLDTDGPYLQA